jgi:hypothetical protein
MFRVHSPTFDNASPGRNTDSPKADNYASPTPASPAAASTYPIQQDAVFDDDGHKSPHKLDEAAARKWTRLCYQRRLLLKAVQNLEELDRFRKDPFPFARTTRAASWNDDKTILRIVNSISLPGLLGIAPSQKSNAVIKRDVKLCNYRGFIMTAKEYIEFTFVYGVYTGVQCTSLNKLLSPDSCWKHEEFVVSLFEQHDRLLIKYCCAAGGRRSNLFRGNYQLCSWTEQNSERCTL